MAASDMPAPDGALSGDLRILDAPGPLRPPAHAVCLVGFMGAGKTEAGRLLAGLLGLPLVDTDDLVEARAGRTIREIFEADGEFAFRDLEHAALREALAGPPAIVATGGGIMLRPDNVNLMREVGPILWLQVTADEALDRVGDAATRPLLDSEDPYLRAAELLAGRESVYSHADYEVDTSGCSPVDCARQIAGLLAADPRACTLSPRFAPSVPIAVPGSCYSGLVGHGLLDRAHVLLDAAGLTPRTAAIVSPEGPCAAYADRLARSLTTAGWRPHLLSVPDGEESKSLSGLGTLWEVFATAGLDRGSVVFAVGGGVVGDLAGMAAATYMRGLPLVHVPTSLLAQIDSSLGGKVAINLSQGKNLAGVFHQPRLVLADLLTLDTLPDAHLLDGLAEGIKHAVLFDADLFAWLEACHAGLLARDPIALRYFVARNVQLKAAVVAADPTESGLRAVLNYGHTVGHALERAAPAWGLTHGQAVAVGMVAEARAAVAGGLSSPQVADRLEALVSAVGLPARAPRLDLEVALAALKLDKKIVQGSLRSPVVADIGTVALCDVDPDFFAAALRAVVS